MSFTRLPQQQTSAEMLAQGLGSAAGQGIQQSLAEYQRGKDFEKAGLPREYARLDPAIVGPLIKQQQKNAMIQQILGGGQQGVQGPPGVQQQAGQPSEGEYSQINKDRQIQALSLVDPNLARIMESQEAPVRKAETKRAYDYLDKIDKERDSINRQESSLIAAKESLANRDFGFLSRDNLARLTGIEGFASKEGAVFDAAAKNFFLADLETAMGRPNQFLERLLSSAIFNTSKSPEANEALVDFYQTQVDLGKKKIEIADELSDAYKRSTGSIPGNIGRLVDKEVKKYAESREKELMEKYKDSPLLKEAKSADFVQMRDPAGNIREVPKHQVNEAKKAKYQVIK